jgi:glycosyltransferase involved in cell wall biosynthesis
VWPAAGECLELLFFRGGSRNKKEAALDGCLENQQNPDNANRPVPFLSVTVLNYNYAHYLRACLDSILSQTLGDFEVILINDCSTDNSLEVIQPYLSDRRIRLVNHEVNQGFVASLREGCDLSRGRYISVISADDYAYDKTAFETAYKVLTADSEIVLFYSAWGEAKDGGEIHYTRRAADHDYIAEGAEQIRRQLLTSDILASGTIMKRDAYHKVGGYDKRCRFAVDNNMWLAICAAGKVAYVNKILYVYRSHSSNMSNTGAALWRTTEEMLWGIDYALGLFSDVELPDKARLRRLAYKRALVAVPTHDIFAGRYRRGWIGYWQAFRHYPILTLAQPRTFVVMAQFVLGPRVITRIRSIVGKPQNRFA